MLIFICNSVSKTASGQRLAWYECACGELLLGNKANVTAKRTQSCSCKLRALRIKHMMCGTPEYVAYTNAKNRCSSPKTPCYKDYGGRGIKFLFASFKDFYAELGNRPDGLSLDRKDNDGHYKKGNVRWATLQEQAQNKRAKTSCP